MTAAAAEDDCARLVAWFRSVGLALDDDAHRTLIAGGRSNLTYRIEDGAGHRYVLRRPPFGTVLNTAHDVAREHRIISALAATEVPVPQALGLCTDPSVIGAAFYVMNLVPGRVVAGEDDGRAYPAALRGVACSNLVDVLGAIHRVDVDAVGLGPLGRRADYAQRQLRRWLKQFRSIDVRGVPYVEQVHDALAATAPPQRYTGLVHGDYRPGNVLLGEDGAVNAVLDWELATLGDVLADLGWLLATWHQPGEVELLESPAAVPGFATRDALIDADARTTGRDVSDIGWYRAFALWRLTCISEGVYIRYRNGAMRDDGFDIAAQGRLVLTLAEAARAAIGGNQS